MGRLYIHMQVSPQEGNWNTETCQKLQQEDTPMGKWAKILLRLKGNMPEVKLQQQKYSHHQREKLSTRAKDRRGEDERRKRSQQQKQEKTAETMENQEQLREEESREKEQKEGGEEEKSE